MDKMRGFCGEVCGAAGEYGGARAEAEFAVGVEEGFQQPAAEEAGAAGDEDALAAQGGEVSVGEDVVEVGAGDGRQHGFYRS